MTHPAGDGYIRAASIPFVGNEVFDCHLRALRQVLDDGGKLPVQLFGLLRVQFAFPSRQPVSPTTAS